MNPISHKETRFADCVIKLDLDAVSSFKRHRGESFVCQSVTHWEAGRAVDLVRLAMSSFPENSIFDFLLGEQLSILRTSTKKFGVGWRVFEDLENIDILLNDLFAKHETTLLIERSVLAETIDVLLESGGKLGKLYFKSPHRDFRYAVFCQLDTLKCSAEIVRLTQVSFSASLPKFIDSGIASKQTVVVKETQKSNLPSAENEAELNVAVCNQASSRMQTVSVEDKLNGEQYFKTRLELTASSSKLVELQKTWEAPVFVVQNSEFVEHNHLSTAQSPASLVDTLSTNDQKTHDMLSFAGESSAPLNKQSDEVLDNMQSNSVVESEAEMEIHIRSDSVFDVSLCVLLDDKVETAIAFAAYLPEIAGRDTRIAEIGLLRRRFKSVFQRFVPVTEIFELTSLSFSRHTANGISQFLSNIADDPSESTPVIVIGRELIESLEFNAFTKFLDASFDNTRIVVFGPGNVDLLSKFLNLSALVDWATESVFVLTNNDAAVADTPDLSENRTVHVYITAYIKQQLLLAEKKGVFIHKLRELERQRLLK